MKKPFIYATVILVGATLTSLVNAQTLAQVEHAAMQGDYQAQRNLAFGYTSWPYEGQKLNPILGCAWRIVILTSDQADTTDEVNYREFCGGLSKPKYDIAKSKAERLAETIEKNNN